MKLEIKSNKTFGINSLAIFDGNGIRRGTLTWLLGGPIPPALNITQTHGWTKRKLSQWCRDNGLAVYWF